MRATTTAMSSLAGMLARRGLQVSGSDQNVYPPASTLLERLGIPVRLGYRPENLDPPPDLVIVGNAVSRTNPEVAAMLERGLAYVSMPERMMLPSGLKAQDSTSLKTPSLRLVLNIAVANPVATSHS